jgi:hypothetical protein
MNNKTTLPPELTDLDHQGAREWVRCELCQAERGEPCKAAVLGPYESPVFLCGVPESGQVHDRRMSSWLDFKARVTAGAGSSHRTPMQQFPRGRR